MKRILILIILAVLLNTTTSASIKKVPFTQEDRDRLVRLETKIDEGFRAINQRIEDINRRIKDTNRRIDDLRDLIYVVLGGMIALIGFVIWDRRTALAPARKKRIKKRP